MDKWLSLAGTIIGGCTLLLGFLKAIGGWVINTNARGVRHEERIESHDERLTSQDARIVWLEQNRG